MAVNLIYEAIPVIALRGIVIFPGMRFHFDVDGEGFTSGGQASVQVKKNLRSLGIAPDIIRRVSIAMYEGEISGELALNEITEQRIMALTSGMKI